MAKADGVFIYIGTYPSEAVARSDYDVVKELHALGAVGPPRGPAAPTRVPDGRGNRTSPWSR